MTTPESAIPEDPFGDPEPVDPDEVAEEMPIDPTPQEVDEYRELIGDDVPKDDVPEIGDVPES